MERIGVLHLPLDGGVIDRLKEITDGIADAMRKTRASPELATVALIHLAGSIAVATDEAEETAQLMREVAGCLERTALLSLAEPAGADRDRGRGP